MAFSVRIKGITKEGGVSFTLEPSWWDANELKRDDRFTVTNDTGSYDDYDADLSVEETRALHEQFREATVSGIYGVEGWQSRIRPILDVLDEALEVGNNKYSHFHVTVFEWESGL